MILVTTAGKVGSEATRLLARRDVPVRVLVRDAKRATELRRAGAEVVTGDLSDRASVDAAMLGIEGVVLVTPAVVEQELGVIDSALRAGVGHIVKITSTAGADSPIARQRGQAEIEVALRASGLSHTLLRNNFYMQNFLMIAPVIARTGGFSASAGEGEVGFVDSDDIGAVAARIVRSPATYPEETYRLTGPGLLSYADVARVLSTVLGRTISFTARTREQDAEEMIAIGVPAPIARMNAHAVSLIAEGDAAWLSEDVSTILGRPPRSFEQFASDHALAFAAR